MPFCLSTRTELLGVEVALADHLEESSGFGLFEGGLAVLDIRNDLAGKAAKIAILHHFTMVLANPAEDLAFKLPMDLPASMKPERFMPVVGSDTEDVTDELVSEVSTLESKDDADGSSEDS